MTDFAETIARLKMLAAEPRDMAMAAQMSRQTDLFRAIMQSLFTETHRALGLEFPPMVTAAISLSLEVIAIQTGSDPVIQRAARSMVLFLVDQKLGERGDDPGDTTNQLHALKAGVIQLAAAIHAAGLPDNHRLITAADDLVQTL